MNILLWVLQVLAALLYGASGVMKVFMFDKVSEGVPSFGALPREAWMALGILELVCTVGLIVPAAFHWKPALTVVAATVLAIESLVFIWVHVQVPRDPAHDLERRAGPPHGVHRVRPDGPEADRLNGGPAPIGPQPSDMLDQTTCVISASHVLSAKPLCRGLTGVPRHSWFNLDGPTEPSVTSDSDAVWVVGDSERRAIVGCERTALIEAVRDSDASRFVAISRAFVGMLCDFPDGA